MEVPRSHDQLPQVTDDDMFAMVFQSHDERWEELAKKQPKLARQIDQNATRVRRDLEDGSITPLEAQRRLIDFGVLVVGAVNHAIAMQYTQEPSVNEPELTPPQST